ncbi:MAG TPA: acyl-CoA carboxylase subunit epsilon [Streptosporangiaceae bacterium]|nr:acyl-CoA carboxylase subunit epsilon [Streptosporangiaceae bacterium]
MPASEARPTPQPGLRVVRGEPTPAELAAVVVVLAARRSSASRDDSRPQRSRWAARERMIRQPLAAGPGAWQSSGLPG